MADAHLAIPEDRPVEIVNPTKFKELEGEIEVLLEDVSRTYMEVAQRVIEIRAQFKAAGSKSRKLLGHDDFTEWAKSVWGQQGRSRVFFYVSIWEKLILGLKVPAETLKGVGWTKSRCLAMLAGQGKVTSSNVHEWVEKAKTTSRRSLEAELEKPYVVPHGPASEDQDSATSEEVVINRIGLYRGQQDIFEKAVALAKKMGETDKLPRAVELICMEFVSAYGGGVAKTEGDYLGHLLSHLEQSFGIRLVAVDEKRGGVVYGVNTLQEADITVKPD